MSLFGLELGPKKKFSHIKCVTFNLVRKSDIVLYQMFIYINKFKAWTHPQQELQYFVMQWLRVAVPSQE